MPDIPSSSEGKSPAHSVSTNAFLDKQGVHSLGNVFLLGEVSQNERLQPPESEEDAVARRRLQLLTFIFRDASVYTVGLLIVIALTFISSYLLITPHASEQDEKWAKGTLSVIGGAVAGYVFGKGSGGKPSY